MIEAESVEEATERRMFNPHLWRQRRSFACQTINESGLNSILDIGCGEGALLEILLNNTNLRKVAGVDWDWKAIGIANRHCQPTENDFRYLRELPINLSLYRGIDC